MILRNPTFPVAALLAAVVLTPAAAQQRLTIAIMPAQYFAAEPESSANVTRGLAQVFEGRGYTVVAAGQARSTFESQMLSPSRHYSDREALRFGRAAQADLVAYPRLLGVGIPAANAEAQGGLLEPAAVVHLRVLNVRTGKPIYFRQIAHEFRAEGAGGGRPFALPQPVATAAATEVTEIYFQQVSGSRVETATAGSGTGRSR